MFAATVPGTRGERRRASIALILVLGLLPALVTNAVPPAAHAASSATIVASPTSGLAGSQVTIAGANFAAPTGTFTPTVTVAFTDANGVKTIMGQTTTSSQAGAFHLLTTLPSTTATGPALFSATDISGTSATVAFDVRPAATHIGAAPSSGVPGTTTVITGTGFAVNEPITLTFTQGTTAEVISAGAVTTTNTGTFSANVLIPGNAGGGTATIMAQDRDSNSSTTSLSVVRAGAPSIGIGSTQGLPGSTVVITGVNFAANQPITLTFAQGATVFSTLGNAVTTNASGAFTVSETLPTPTGTGNATITAADRSGNTAAVSYTPYNTANGPSTQYFAEGYTGQYTTNHRATFNESFSILNPNPFTATVTITYLVQGGSPVAVTRAIAPQSTLRESANSDLGPDKIAAAIVSSPSHIVAERIIQRSGSGGTTLDSNSSLGNTALSTTYYFAEGYTGITFQEYLTIANPGATAAHVTVTFAPQAASSAHAPVESFVVPANGRVTRNIRSDTLGLANKSVGMIVTSDQPLMAERVIYFGAGDGSGKFGSTAKAGITSPSSQYYFAFGSTGGTGLGQRAGDQAFVTVLNPDVSTAPATVTAHFVDATGKSLGSATVTVAPGTRQTIRVSTTVGAPSSVIATLLTSTQPVVAELPQYFGGSPNEGSHSGTAYSGLTAAVKTATFPDLSLSNALGAAQQQTVFLYNPTAATITVGATYYASSGTKTASYSVPAGGIATVNVNSDAAGLPSGPLAGVFAVTSSGAADAFVAANVANTADGVNYTGTQGF